MQLFSNDLGVDLGTSNVLIYADGKGLVVREPSVVAVDRNTGKILQVGSAARNMLNRTPGNGSAVFKQFRTAVGVNRVLTVDESADVVYSERRRKFPHRLLLLPPTVFLLFVPASLFSNYFRYFFDGQEKAEYSSLLFSLE